MIGSPREDIACRQNTSSLFTNAPVLPPTAPAQLSRHRQPPVTSATPAVDREVSPTVRSATTNSTVDPSLHEVKKRENVTLKCRDVRLSDRNSQVAVVKIRDAGTRPLGDAKEKPSVLPVKGPTKAEAIPVSNNTLPFEDVGPITPPAAFRDIDASFCNDVSEKTTLSCDKPQVSTFSTPPQLSLAKPPTAPSPKVEKTRPAPNRCRVHFTEYHRKISRCDGHCEEISDKPADPKSVVDKLRAMPDVLENKVCDSGLDFDRGSSRYANPDPFKLNSPPEKASSG